MSSTTVFACPSCAAQLRVDGNEYQVRCPYCGSLVTVPTDLRRPVVAPPPTVDVVVNVAMPVAPPPQPMVYSAPRRSSCSGFLVTLILLVVAGGGAFAWYEYNNAGHLSFINVPNVLGSGDGKLQQTFGGAGTGGGLFQDANRVAVDGAGNIYVGESKSHRIQQFDANGKFNLSWNYEAGNATGPSALTADRNGMVYIIAPGQTDGGILKYNGDTGVSQGVITSTSDAKEFIHFGFEDLAVLADGGLLAMSQSLISDDVVHFDANGHEVKRIPKLISSVTGGTVVQPRIAVDGLGNFFALDTIGVDTGSTAIFRFTADGKFVNRFGSLGDSADQLNNPAAIAVDNQSRVYVSDFKGVHIFAGDGRHIGHIDLSWGYVPALAFTPQNELLLITNNQVQRYSITLPTTP